MLWHHNLHAAHIWLQHLRNLYGAVCLKVILQEGNQHTRRSHNGVIQSMGKIFVFVLILYTNL